MKTNTIHASTQPNTSYPIISVWATWGFTAARLLLGVLLLFGVVNAVFTLAPQPPLSQQAQVVMTGLFSAPYFFALLKGSEFLVAVALLSNRFVPLALLVLAPITINILLFHLFLAPAGLPIALGILVFHLATAWSHRKNYRSILAVK